ncbi:MAG TPA: MarR family winged helix-turn-helix transcriptional regulator [Acidimicrobiales bacterium]|nr:MarR family winged helix-turn-helix transcriptional regulator [Acidimicrobiales bacterium]
MRPRPHAAATRPTGSVHLAAAIASRRRTPARARRTGTDGGRGQPTGRGDVRSPSKGGLRPFFVAQARGYRHAISARPTSRRGNPRGATSVDYARLLDLRTGLRTFLHWSDESAREAGLTPAQHQLLLAVRGHEDPRGPTIGDLAGYLMLRHHSAVGLVDRGVASGIVARHEDADDLRVVRVRLTAKGARLLDRLASSHTEELRRLQIPRLRPLWEDLPPA